MHYLAICAIIKDEDLYLREWAAYHSLLGVEHFYLYDNESARSQARALEGFEAGRFTFVPWPGVAQQMPAYNHCLKTFGKDCRWLAYIDVDEFICPMEDDDLRALLAEYEEYAGLAIPWLMFGSSGHLRRPEGMTLKNFQETLPEEYDARHNIIKCIVDPARTLKILDPHKSFPKEGEYVVSEDHRPVTRGANRVIRSVDKVRLNHYFYRSQEEFEAKLARGRSDRADEAGRYPYEQFYVQARDAVLPDSAIQRFVPQTRAAMFDPGILPPARGCDTQFHELVGEIYNLVRQRQFGRAEALMCASAVISKDYVGFWIMRSMLAREAGHPDRALRFAYKALYCAEVPEVYWEIFQNRLVMGQEREARNTLLCMKGLVNKLCSAKIPEALAWRERLVALWPRYVMDKSAAARPVHVESGAVSFSKAG